MFGDPVGHGNRLACLHVHDQAGGQSIEWVGTICFENLVAQNKTGASEFDRHCQDSELFAKKALAAVVVIDVHHHSAVTGRIKDWLSTPCIPVPTGIFHQFDCLDVIKVSQFVRMLFLDCHWVFDFQKALQRSIDQWNCTTAHRLGIQCAR